MFRSIPVSNKICFDKELKRNWKIHEQKLSQMRSKLSNQRAQQFTFLQQTKKRNVLKDIHNRQIQRSNNILFKRIQQIQIKGNKNSYYQQQNQKQTMKSPRLLHQPYRKRQIFRIVQQNQQMLKRLRDKKSSYNVRKMQKERKDIEKNISLISQFQYKRYPVTQTKVNLYMTEQKSSILGGSRISNKRQNSTIDASQYQPRCKTTIKTRSRNYFSQSAKQLNDLNYLITTYMCKGVFFIEVQNIENHLQKYRMQMTQKQLQKLLDKFYQNRLQNLVGNLQIDQKQDGGYCYLKFEKDL